jgi:isopenicillin-N N-acyltransferase-like protein
MSPLNARRDEPLRLSGTPFERGRLQATLCPEMIGFVRAAVAARMEETRQALARPEARALIDGDRGYTERHYPEILEEMQGICDGFGLSLDTLFDYMHCAVVSDLAATAERLPEGCTSFAVADPELGAVVVKNRDYRPEHIPIQRAFHHRDPAWGKRQVLCLGSLGSPGNFSSGINSDGLAVTDTNSRTTDHGVGMHRYFLLTWLLVHCGSVDEALDRILGMPHVGGGLLILGDAGGTVAAVELGHKKVGHERRVRGRVGRANHFVTPEMAAANLRTADSEAQSCHSDRRHPTLQQRLVDAPSPFGLADAARLASYHGEDGGEGFCRHGGKDLGNTISSALYATRPRTLTFTAGNPCQADWRLFDFAGDVLASRLAS